MRGLLSKEIDITSQGFINLAIKVMSFSDLASKFPLFKSEERKETEFDWIWKDLAQPQDIISQVAPNSKLIDV